MIRNLLFASLLGTFGSLLNAQQPSVKKTEWGGQLMVGSSPYLVLGGELGNSSAGTAVQADTILPRLAALHVNTVLMPVAWEQVEPKEGSFDFSILDHWIEVARTQHVHLVLLWFGSWKNAFSNYAPLWVKSDTRRFPRAIGADGNELEILSTLGTETLQADERAFTALMSHVKQADGAQGTVLMAQVENEVGYLGQGRDRSAQANRLFQSRVPAALLESLHAHPEWFSPELTKSFHPQGKTWREVFGDAADEVFMAYLYARYIQGVAAAGKQADGLPMYVNVQLPAPAERAGEYPSGGPHPYYQAIYRATAPAIDFYSPDIYWPNFEYWIDRYVAPGNPVFVPEARIETSPLNALYAYGEARAFGFCPFGIDSLQPTADASAKGPTVEQTYAALESIKDLLLAGQASGATRAVVLHANSPRPTQTIALGGYLFQATLSRSWPAKALLTDDGGMLVLQTAPDEFLVIGSGLTVTFERDPDMDDKVAGIGSIEEVTRSNGTFSTLRRLNGDQSNQGRQLSMAPLQTRMYRVVLYATKREGRQ